MYTSAKVSAKALLIGLGAAGFVAMGAGAAGATPLPGDPLGAVNNTASQATSVLPQSNPVTAPLPGALDTVTGALTPMADNLSTPVSGRLPMADGESGATGLGNLPATSDLGLGQTQVLDEVTDDAPRVRQANAQDLLGSVPAAPVESVPGVSEVTETASGLAGAAPVAKVTGALPAGEVAGTARQATGTVRQSLPTSGVVDQSLDTATGAADAATQGATTDPVDTVTEATDATGLSGIADMAAGQPISVA
ncbi:hypothetical protein [Salinactinospora qingdaonensis]|uniref:GLTT repeat-containing protein n=1 Tax=Salinactinospora qingdaonensis TaxID=702744 RepID=A0ABP7GG14_9ACTN